MKTSFVLTSLFSLAFMGAASAATVTSTTTEVPAATQVKTQKTAVEHKTHAHKTQVKTPQIKHEKAVAHKKSTQHKTARTDVKQAS